MAGLTKDQIAAKKEEADKNNGSREDDGLVEITNGRDSLRVHPSCVDAHKNAGWTIA